MPLWSRCVRLRKPLVCSIGLRVHQSESIFWTDLQVINDPFSAQPHFRQSFKVLNTDAGMESRE